MPDDLRRRPTGLRRARRVTGGLNRRTGGDVRVPVRRTRSRSAILLGSVVLAVLVSACTATITSRRRRRPRRPPRRSGTWTPSGPIRSPTSWSRSCPPVVNVTTDVFSPDGSGGQGQGVGTGFIVRSDGFIVTNCHVIERASRISVFTSDEEPDRYDARVVGGDCLHDLAIPSRSTRPGCQPCRSARRGRCAWAKTWSRSGTPWRWRGDRASPPASCRPSIGSSRSRTHPATHAAPTASGPTRM